MNIENELKENGFSDKDLKRLQEVLAKEHNKDETLSSLVTDLSKRFWGGIIGLAIISTAAVYGFFHVKEKADIFSYSVVIIFAFLVVYFITPMSLAWKSYRYMTKKK